MTEIDNLKDAKAFIKNNKYSSIIWHSSKCPACKHYLDDIDSINIDCPDFAFAKICYELWKDDFIFEPENLPSTFIYKNGIRMFNGPGQAPKEVVVNYHNDIENGTFKSAKQIEEEQLAQLDKDT